MKRLNLVEIKEVEIKILLSISKFCEKNNLKYYLAGGTLLGAVRHKGFIPWDDDIDICMPRKDYEFFVNNFSCCEQYRVISNINNTFDRPFSRVIDTKTYIEWEYFQNRKYNHIWVDICPVDGLPDDLGLVALIFKKCNFYRKLLGIADARLGYGNNFVKKYAKYILKPIANLYGKNRCIKEIEKIAKENTYENSKYVGVVTCGLLGVGQRMLKSEFEKAVEVEFEGHKFPAFSCWDGYLKGMYGDYMKLPPIDQRKTHELVAYLIAD